MAEQTLCPDSYTIMGRNIRPLKDNVLVKQDPPKEKVGSLFVPQGSRDLYEDTGTVVAVGPGRISTGGEIIRPDVKIGDRVLFVRQPGSALNPDTREGESEWESLLMMKAENIIGVLEPEPVMQGDYADHTLPEERR